MVLRFRKKSKSEWLVWFTIMMPFAFFLLMDVLYLPSIVKYTVDIAWIGLLISLLKYRNAAIDSSVSKLAIIAGLFFVASIVGFVLNYQSPLYYLWGLRNNARFFIFFFACVFFVKEHDIEAYMRFFDVMFWINFGVVLYQYFVLQKTQDFLGGIFGVEKGCNAYMTIFLVIIVAKSLLSYMFRQERLVQCLSKFTIALIIAALSELKFFFVLLIILVVLATGMTGLTFRKVLFIIMALVGVGLAIEGMITLFPEYAEWFNFQSMWDTATSSDGYTSSGDMNRLTAVSQVFDSFLPKFSDKLFGLGLGNCDYASFDFLTTPFYLKYRKLNYVWFSTAFLALETGAVGIILYALFFVFLFFAVSKLQKKQLASPLYCRLSKILAIMSIFIVIYNASMRTEAAFMMYFVLSLPFIQAQAKLANVGVSRQDSTKKS